MCVCDDRNEVESRRYLVHSSLITSGFLRNRHDLSDWLPTVAFGDDSRLWEHRGSRRWRVQRLHYKGQRRRSNQERCYHPVESFDRLKTSRVPLRSPVPVQVSRVCATAWSLTLDLHPWAPRTLLPSHQHLSSTTFNKHRSTKKSSQSSTNVQHALKVQRRAPIWEAQGRSWAHSLQVRWSYSGEYPPSGFTVMRIAFIHVLPACWFGQWC